MCVCDLLRTYFFTGGFLSLVSQKNEAPPARTRGSPLKTQLLNKFEDYNDSGYGGSPLPGNYSVFIQFYLRVIHVLLT